MGECTTWAEGDIVWDATDFTWSEICLLVEVVTQGGGYSDPMPHFNHMKQEYERYGYDLPKIVFWNLDAHYGTPAESDTEGVAMVSGFNPKIMEAVLNAEDFNPISVMLEALKAIELDYRNLPTQFKYKKEIR